MAKSKEYNGAVVEAEFLKVSLAERLELYTNLGEWLHQQVIEHQDALGKELNHFEAAKTKLKK